jgi:hypothetical protein
MIATWYDTYAAYAVHCSLGKIMCRWLSWQQQDPGRHLYQGSIASKMWLAEPDVGSSTGVGVAILKSNLCQQGSLSSCLPNAVTRVPVIDRSCPKCLNFSDLHVVSIVR